MSSKVVTEVSRNIKFIENELIDSSSEMKKVMYEIIKDQTKRLMLAKANPEYAFVILNEAKVPENRSSPRRTVIVLITFFSTLILSCMFFIFNQLLRKDNA